MKTKGHGLKPYSGSGGSWPGYLFTCAPLKLAAGHFGLGHGSRMHAPDEYFLVEPANPKVAGYDAAVEGYNQLIADALRQVVDRLASARSVAAQRIEQRQGLATATDAYDLAVLRYREGVGNYLQVLTTQTQLLEQRSLDADLRARALDLSVNLVQALGGGLNLESKS